MAQVVLLNPTILINSVDLSNRCDQVTIEETFADVDTTTFGATAKTRVAGLGDHKFTFEYTQDFALAEVDATVSPLVGTATLVSCKLAGATSSVNPAYSFTAVVTQYKPIDGKVGDLLKGSVTWPISGAVTRSTS